ELVAAIAGRLRQDAERIAAATLSVLDAAAASRPSGAEAAAAPVASGDDHPLPPAGTLGESLGAPAGEAGATPLSVGADELAMLAEAAGQLDEEFGAAIARQPGDAAAPVAVDDVAESLEAGADAIERFANAIGYVGLAPVASALESLRDNLLALARDPQRFDARHRALLARLAPAWARLFREPSPPVAAEALALLGDPAWPEPARRASLDVAQRQFGALETVASRRVAAAEAPIDEGDLSLDIPVDADRNVVDNLLRELPMLSAEFSACIDRLHAGDSEAIAAAQRIAHTLKGSANTVGVRGIAVLTHQLEDLLQLLESTEGALAPELDSVLADAADCVAEMSECVAGLGPVPSGAHEVLQRVRDWTNRLLQEPSAAFPPAASPPAAVAPPQAAAPAPAPARAPAPAPEEPTVAEAVSEGLTAEVPAAGETQEWLRVPASLIERLLAFANEASILLSQAQEQA